MKKKNLHNIIMNENKITTNFWEKCLKNIFKNFVLIGNESLLGLMTLIY